MMRLHGFILTYSTCFTTEKFDNSGSSAEKMRVTQPLKIENARDRVDRVLFVLV